MGENLRGMFSAGTMSAPKEPVAPVADEPEAAADADQPEAPATAAEDEAEEGECQPNIKIRTGSRRSLAAARLRTH